MPFCLSSLLPRRALLRREPRPGLLLGLLLAASPLAGAAPVYPDVETCREALAQPAPESAAPMPETVRVVSWNTEKYRHPGARELLAQLSAEADLVAIQESVRGAGTAGESLAHRYFAEGYQSRSEQTGVELRSRAPATMSCHLTFVEPWLRTPKAVLAGRYRYADADLLVVSLHAINFTLGVDGFRTQFEAVGELLAAHAGPAVVIGDFNNWNGRRQEVLETFARRHDLQIADFTPDLRSRHLGRPVDGLLQRGLEVVSVAALPTPTSDHHPILAHLRKPAAAPPGADNRAPGVAR